MFATTDLLVGVDVHRRTNVMQVRNGRGEMLTKPQRVPKNRSGTATFSQQVADLAQAGNFDQIHIAAEATGNYWLPFFCELEQSPTLAAWPVSLYPFNPQGDSQIPSLPGRLGQD